MDTKLSAEHKQIQHVSAPSAFCGGKDWSKSEVTMEKLAVAADGDVVSAHFGHCSQYVLVEAEGGKVLKRTTISNPGHEPGKLPRYLAELGVTCVVAGGMGPRAQQNFAAHGISTVVGITGTVEQAVQAWLSGELSGGDNTCGRTGHGHAG
jgi:predicted Fe-Mo cluster-binding NifX family protein